MDAIVKKSLGAPVRQLSSCVSGVKEGMSRKGKSTRRKSAPCCYSTAHDSSWVRTYQAELHRERKVRQVMLSQKNAERTAMRSHYRSPHRYTKTSQNRKPINTKTPSKNDDSLFGAFQGLSLNMGGTQASAGVSPSAEQCKMM
ncbi:hypothetical protein AMEX_G4912 [Astyanax mexicanus]|uniref:Uncharacterized protein n=1 Tax=Astyanax mexicanus TaxID=7994 RepID=A0A8T2M887_ASTMX|nr:hypothetical protein AMEX_G4912 [Astyanax mexicanus]